MKDLLNNCTELLIQIDTMIGYTKVTMKDYIVHDHGDWCTIEDDNDTAVRIPVSKMICDADGDWTYATLGNYIIITPME